MIENATANDPGLHVRHALKSNTPFLRRYARAVTGNQRLSDVMVIAIIDAVSTDPVDFNTTKPVRVELYRHLTRSLCATAPASCTASELMRQVELLTKVEGFSASEADYILAMSAGRSHELLASSAVNCAEKASVLIVEDEPLIAMQLEDVVHSLGLDLIGTVATRSQVRKRILTRSVSLVLSDVQLADGSSGIDAVTDILEKNAAPVIFITAYPEKLLTGRRPEPIFLISKPFVPEAVAATIKQALYLGALQPVAANLAA